MTSMVEYAYVSHAGKRREKNEDNFWCAGKFLPVENTGMPEVVSGTADGAASPVFAVFDGMGGESSGELAAFIAAQTLDQVMKDKASEPSQSPEPFLHKTCEELNRAVLAAEDEHRIDSMGSTAAMLLLQGSEAYSANLGDSRMYHFRGEELEQISEDHVYRVSYGKPPLVQYLGLREEEVALEPTIRRFRLREDDRILLCTDGLTDMLKEEQIAAILKEEPDVSRAVERLLNAALEQGGRDNVTMILCKVPGGRSLGDKLKKIAGYWRKSKP